MPGLIDVIIPENERSATALKNVFIVMEFEESDLRNALLRGHLCGVSQTHVKLIFYNLLCAIKFMHSANVIHRDLKPANILISEECEIKICDFGIARTLPESHIGKGSGNTRRIRDNLHKTNLKHS